MGADEFPLKRNLERAPEGAAYGCTVRSTMRPQNDATDPSKRAPGCTEIGFREDFSDEEGEGGVYRLPIPCLITSFCAVCPDALYVPRPVSLAAGPVRASRAVSGLFGEAGMRLGRPLHSRSFAASYSRSVRASVPSFEVPASLRVESQPISSSFLFFVSPSVSLLFKLMCM